MKAIALPLEIVWSVVAQTKLREIRAYIARDKPEAAEHFAARIVALTEALRNHPYLGRIGNRPGIRELMVGGTPFIIVYQIRGKRIIISTVRHGAQTEK